MASCSEDMLHLPCITGEALFFPGFIALLPSMSDVAVFLPTLQRGSDVRQGDCSGAATDALALLQFEHGVPFSRCYSLPCPASPVSLLACLWAGSRPDWIWVESHTFES